MRSPSRRLYTDRLTEHVERLAYHTLEGKVWDLAVRYLRQAGAKSSARHSLHEAVAWFDQALGALEHLAPTRATLELEAEIRFARQPIVHLLGDYRLAQEYLLDIEGLAERLGDDHYRGRAYRTKANICNHSGDLDEAVVYSTRALEIAQKLDDLSLRVGATNNLEQTYFMRGEHQTVIDLARANLAALPTEGHDKLDGNGPAATDRGWLVRSLAEKLGWFVEVGSASPKPRSRLPEVMQWPYALGRACHLRGSVHLGGVGRRALADERAIAVFREGGVVTTRGTATATSAGVLACLGESSLALTRAHDAATPGARPRAQGTAWYFLAVILVGPQAYLRRDRSRTPSVWFHEYSSPGRPRRRPRHPIWKARSRSTPIDANRRGRRTRTAARLGWPTDADGVPLPCDATSAWRSYTVISAGPSTPRAESATALAMLREMDGGDERRAHSLLASLSS